MHTHKIVNASELQVGNEFDMFGSTAVVVNVLLNENDVVLIRVSIKQFNSTAYSLLHIPSHYHVQINQ